ncbi:MAG: hypothetical protein M5U26_11530 [Planctomycetota bacterium]|nr:hypothetical protein [Planctomycetota bacterium]
MRGFIIKNVKQHGIQLSSGHHIVIEDCDISKWEAKKMADSGRTTIVVYIVVQRTSARSLFNAARYITPPGTPTVGRKSAQTTAPTREVHRRSVSENPKEITWIRYNELWSDDDHYYNDTIGGHINGSYRGSPGADSDIYCNYIASCWDDGIEAEGGDQNVRIWNNYIENVHTAIGNAACSIGPLYIWRNVSGTFLQPSGQ